MSVFRSKQDKHFSQIPNETLRTIDISLKAKGMLSLMLSFDRDWEFHQSQLATMCKESKHSIRTAIQELEDAGYIQRSQKRTENGSFDVMIYDVFDTPTVVQLPDVQLSDDGTSDIGKSATKNNNSQEDQESKNNNTRKRTVFVKPTAEELREYSKSIGFIAFDADEFLDHYTSNGWLVGGKSPMKDWQACVRTWRKNQYRFGKQPPTQPPHQPKEERWV